MSRRFRSKLDGIPIHIIQRGLNDFEKAAWEIDLFREKGTITIFH